ncbi:HigA family addiction module antitoxin [Vibrio parahaemolyticus]|uniref:HigA family addiction module antitoxin n=1 Tax=Vibrio parahaemolyticus TaxID=670 RepID=UPI003D7D5CD4
MSNSKSTSRSVGETLLKNFLEPMNIKIADLSNAINVHRNTVSNLINGKTSLTVELASKLAIALNTTPEYWLNIQHQIDLDSSRKLMAELEYSVITIDNRYGASCEQN